MMMWCFYTETLCFLNIISLVCFYSFHFPAQQFIFFVLLFVLFSLVLLVLLLFVCSALFYFLFFFFVAFYYFCCCCFCCGCCCCCSLFCFIFVLLLLLLLLRILTSAYVRFKGRGFSYFSTFFNYICYFSRGRISIHTEIILKKGF